MTQKLASFFLNKQVVAKNGKDLGEVEDVYLDTEGWNVQSLRLKLAPDVKEELKPDENVLLSGESVKLPVKHVAGVDDMVTLTNDMNELTFMEKAEGEM